MKCKLAKVVNLFRQFGACFSIKYLYYKIRHKDEKYIELTYNYLREYLLPLIEKFNNTKENINYYDESNSKIPIWVCWWQGYKNMPELCKMFFDRLNEMLPSNADLKLITLDNYLQYAKIPDNIVRKFNEGKISMTTYSDVLRNYLLYNNGGMWIDASVFVSNNISEEFLNNKEWWSINLYSKNDKIINLGQKITNRKWSGFIQKGIKNNILNKFVCEAFELYYAKYDIIIDYFIQNLFIKIAYDNIAQINKIIDNIPVNNVNVYDLFDNVDKEFDKEVYNKWNSRTLFYKFTQKRQYSVYTSDNKLTYFGAIKNICEKNGDVNYGEK